MKTKKLFSTKRGIAAVVISGALVAAGAGIAAAFFSASGTASGTTTVGKLTPLTVVSTGSSGTIFPGAPSNSPSSATLTFQVSNPTPTHGQTVTTVTATVDVTNTGGSPTYGDILTNEKTFTPPVSGCLGSWFTVSPSGIAVGTHLDHGGASKTVHVKVGLTTTGTQNACESAHPTVTLKVTGKA